MATREADVKLEALKATADHVDPDAALKQDNKDVPSDIGTAASSLGLSEQQWEAAEKSLVRKLDMTLVPMVWILYLFNYLDRNNIAQAKLGALEEDLNLKGSDFNTAVSILNVGYMLAQLPSNMILTRVRPSLYLPACTALWSAVSASTAAASSYRHLVVIRFFLGVVEAPYFPGAMYLLSCWYPRRELALRTAILYSGVLLATAFSGLIAAGVLDGLDGARGIGGWQWLFIIEGAGSFIAAMVAFLVLPDFPGQKSGVSRWILSDTEQKVAVERIRRDRVSQPEESQSVWNGLLLAAKDVRTWVFTVMLTANHSAYGFNNFFPTIVEGFGLGSRTITLVLTAPPYLVATATAFATAWSSDRRGDRGYHIAVPQAVACVGFVISVATLNDVARYTAAFLYICGCFSSNAMVFSWASLTLSQTPEKRAVATAIINLLSQLGNIWSPYFFPESHAPRYVMANILMMVSSLVSVATCVVMKIMLRSANRKLRATGESVSLFTL